MKEKLTALIDKVGKKRFIIISVISSIVIIGAITGLLVAGLVYNAFCDHQWKPATCTEPEICEKCGNTQGTHLEHIWVDADCANPKTCSLCKETIGEALGHKWTDADCETPKTCKVCKETEGDALGHRWKDATCKDPKTCSVCGKTEGTKTNNHKWKDATCSSAKTCSICGKTEGKPLKHKWKDATCDKPKTCSLCKKTDGEALGHNFKKGLCTRCEAEDPNYTPASKVEDYDDLVSALNKNFSSIETPLGTITDIDFEIEYATRITEQSYMPYDFYIQVSADMIFYADDMDIDIGEEFLLMLPYDLDSLYLTEEQRQATTDAMMNFHRNIADFAMEAFPDKKIAGGFYDFTSGHWNSNFNWIDTDTDRYFTWCNFEGDNAAIGSYDRTYISGFRWDSTFDDRWYGYSD